ncbi:MAG: class I SAM-dependent methyltransferase, partial [Prevotella sp.]
MSKEKMTIHEFEFDVICDYFSRTERQGPGSDEATMRALQFVGGLDSESRIADIGCGTGGQTMVLAKNLQGSITGIDLAPRFIDIFNRKTAENGFADRVKGIVGTMEDLPFEDESLDLIWSEGAIYNIGFERGINEWRRFLKPDGYLAVSESSWLTDERPDEIEQFWKESYAEMDTIPVKLSQMQRAGYQPLAVFALPENCWTDNFYVPQAKARKAFLQAHPGNSTAEMLVKFQCHEEELYR